MKKEDATRAPHEESEKERAIIPAPSENDKPSRGIVVRAKEVACEIATVFERMAMNWRGDYPKRERPRYLPYRTLPDIVPSRLDQYQMSFERLPDMHKADELLDFYKAQIKIAGGKKAEFWRDLQSEWAKLYPHMPLPHIASEPTYPLRFSRYKECIVETYPDETVNYFDPPEAYDRSLYGVMCRVHDELNAHQVFPPRTPRKRLLSHFEVDQLIEAAGDDTLAEIGMDPGRNKIIPIPHELYLLLARKNDWGRGNAGTIVQQEVRNHGNSSTVLAGGEKSGPTKTMLVCHFAGYIKHSHRCFETHRPGMVRLAIVPKTLSEIRGSKKRVEEPEALPAFGEGYALSY